MKNGTVAVGLLVGAYPLNLLSSEMLSAGMSDLRKYLSNHVLHKSIAEGESMALDYEDIDVIGTTFKPPRLRLILGDGHVACTELDRMHLINLICRVALDETSLLKSGS